METFLFSTLAVAIAEIGDKTQLLALVLAARYRRFWPLAAGITVATLLNHAVAAWIGQWLASLLAPTTLRWLLAGSLVAIALWTLKPDKLDGETSVLGNWGAFAATTVAFFLAEIGDKTQIATVILAAKYEALLWVVAGTTLGMLIANLPVVWLGTAFAHRLPLRAARIGAALLFALLAVLVILRDPAGG